MQSFCKCLTEEKSHMYNENILKRFWDHSTTKCSPLHDIMVSFWTHRGKKITTKISLTSQMFRLVSKWRLCIKLMVDFYFKPLVISHMSSLKRIKKWDLLNISFVSLMRLNWDQMEIVANNSSCSDVFPWETYHSIFSHLSLLKFEFSTNSQTVLGYSMISVCRGCKISLIF